MKSVIYGAGAVGCMLGSKLHAAGEDVTLIARGEQLQALQANGLKILQQDKETVYHIPATDKLDVVEDADYVFITTKAYSLPSIIPGIAPLLRDDAAVILLCNGIPWWFFQVMEGEMRDYHSPLLDPDRILADSIDNSRIIGGLCYMGVAVIEPGIIKSRFPPRVMVGEPSNKVTERVQQLADMLEHAGFREPLSDNIRSAILTKLCWNIAFNCLSVLTGKSSIEMVEDQDIANRALAIMAEMQKIAEKLHIPLQLTPEEHSEIARKTGRHKPSMLQDYEQDKKLEINEIIGVICEVGDRVDLPIPSIRATYQQLTALLN